MFKANHMFLKKGKLLVNLQCIALTSVAGTDILFRASPDMFAPYVKFTFDSLEAADTAMMYIEKGIEANTPLLTFCHGE